MKAPEQLPTELVWTADGHLGEVAMTAIADGEEAILPREAFGHLGVCETCAAGVESAASLSASVTRALGAPLLAIAKVVCDRVEPLKPVGELLGR